MTRFRGVAWDVDGTLVDSEALHHRALIVASAGAGVDLSDLSQQTFCGVHIFDVWDRLAARMQTRVDKRAWLDAIERHYVEHRAEIVAIPEAAATVRTLASRGVAQACVSNSHRAFVAANLDALGIAGEIAFSICLDDVGAGKPDPEPYRMACVRLRLAPHLVVAVEDSVTGARSASAAGLYVVGYSPTGEPFGSCQIWIRSLSEMARLFDEP